MSARRALSTALAALALAAPGLARAQVSLNVISAVELKDEGSSVVLSVKGSKPPNFTTFSMADPPRFVIDLSESRFEGVPEDIVVQDGLVNVVKNLSYGADATSIARVMVAFMVDVEPPDVQTAGNTLVVRVLKPGAPAVAAAPQAAEPAPAATEAGTSGAAGGTADAGGSGGAAVAAGAAGVAAVASDDQDRAAREQAEAQAAAERERLAREEQERRDAEARAEQDRLAREELSRREAALAAAAAETARLEQQRAAEAARGQEAEREALAAATPPPVPEAPPESAASALPVERLEAGAPAARLQEIGFKQMPGVSRVYVRTTVTPRFTVQELDERTIRVEFENTRVTRRNDTRFMDTSFFASAVELIKPSRRGSSYVVDIQLRERVPFQQSIMGDMLAIDFQRPAAPAPAPGPDAAAPDEAGTDPATEPAAAPAEQAPAESANPN